MIQLRRVPDDVYTVVKERAEAQGVSISDYVVKELTVRFGSAGAEEIGEKSSPAVQAD